MGNGVGRYGSSTITDVTIEPNGVIAPLHGFSALSTVELNPTPRMNIYLNYGGDYIGRDILTTASGAASGYGNPRTTMTGCNNEIAATTTYSNSGTGFGNSSNPANCGGNNKDVQEITAGYWYNIYSGAKGRLRRAPVQYIERDLWSGTGSATYTGTGGVANPGGGAKGTDNMIFTSFRYYLP